MPDRSDRRWQLFLELFNSLPRQGPGSRACAKRALKACAELRMQPEILDIGCGSGAQTLYLSQLTGGTVVALDSNESGINVLRQRLIADGISASVRTKVADMLDPDEADDSFDLVWSEGALYSVGLAQAIPVCRRLLREDGYLAFTDAVWLRDDPPSDVVAMFESEYPTMGSTSDVVRLLHAHGFEVLDHFPLPDTAWWEEFYTPMERRLSEMRETYTGDNEALSILDELALEPEMHRRYSHFYGYEFFIARKQRHEAGRHPAFRAFPQQR